MRRNDLADPLAPKKPRCREGQARHLSLHGGRAESSRSYSTTSRNSLNSMARCLAPRLLKGYRAAFINPNSKLLGPKFKFQRYGKSQTELGELLAASRRDCRR